MPSQTDAATAESLLDQPPAKVKRTDTKQWHDIRKYLLARAAEAHDTHTVIPRPICTLCEYDGELDIAGVPASSINCIRFDGVVLACGHMFCIPCLNEYNESLPRPHSPYAKVNPVCGRRMLFQGYRCPICRGDMHHKECRCEVGASELPKSDLLDLELGQWEPKMLHPGDQEGEDTQAMEAVTYCHPWIYRCLDFMDEVTRQKLVHLVNAVTITMPDVEAGVVTAEDDDDNNNNDNNDDR